MVIMVLCLLLFFAKVRIKPKLLRKAVVLFGRCSFGVSMFHVRPVMWNIFLYLRYKEYTSFSTGKLAFSVIGTAVILFVLFDLLSITRYMFLCRLFLELLTLLFVFDT